ncbi:MAG: hypothetical protein A3B10_01660 [Candidatus Doudnabacteria bacterium RIFCSPLOWO2_01_FULL_44_21]|uniref:DUF5658 domain-containing protein n=1 Tax=Candidatus Doudnabacteria bacterium RIFCSPLOWO2_01_FULL_44_21 TaxID=1817841 RepID=A0A1F5Q2M8_9BACT|nr:MAG: hypothetical protein A3B95_01540 [Candidatus Doudnabacteria bacterium RIFCSPHIGHO2_02_FULL_43_13b]OGE96374.1 MAG: hypothetical protein A3B10_01660 [Candidatus Doudnabacteria bacterium RIFCSPLOWO2_01_FULL_44_21]
MIKGQNVWLWVSLGMFLVPEILFSFLLSSVLFLFRINVPYLIGKLVGEQFFIDNQSYLFLALIIEILGILGLLIFNIKFNRSRFKSLLSFSLFILLAFAILIFYTVYYMRNGIGF